MDLKKLIKGVGSGEKGFTLIELLVVIAILGIIAAVVVLNIGSFMGSGAEEAANTEAHQVQTAVIAYMQATDSTSFTAVMTINNSSTEGPEDYLLNPSRLQCEYTIATDGAISGATAGGKFGECDWVSGAWETC